MKYIKSRILIAMLSLMLITLGALTFIFHWYISSINSEMLSTSMATLSGQAASNFDYMINEKVSEFQNAATSSEYAQQTSNSDRLKMLTEHFMDNDAFSSIAVYNTAGQLKSCSSPLCSSLLDPTVVKDCADRGVTVVTDVYEYDGANYFIVLVPLDKKEQPMVSAAAISCEAINRKLSALIRDRKTEIYVVNDSGKVLFLANEMQMKLNQNPIELAKTSDAHRDLANAVSSAIHGRSGFCSYKNSNTSYTMGYETVSHFDSNIITITDSGAFNDEYGKKEFSLIGLTMAALFLLTLLFANFFSSSISKPIASTTERLRKLANGDTSSSVDVWNSKDELGVLSNSLGETVSCLRLYINVIKHGLEQISKGNLTYRMRSGFKGDFSQIESTFNDIFDQLCNTFDSINHSAEQVTSGAVQVANSAHSLSQGATQQASAIEELSATLSNVSDQVVQNSDSARNAYKIVDDNSHAIEDCNGDMTKLLEAMQLISDTTEEITQILKAIDEISFQTNILALNAAVEAAREGSKGFGVVADEVRRLAARTAEAAKQTSALIDKTSDAVTSGHSIAMKTAESLRDVEESSSQICLLMRNIADASADQSDAILQINTGVDQISDVVSANTAAAIGSASASEELSGQSLILKNMIAKFKFYDGGQQIQAERPASFAAAKDHEMDYDFSIDPDAVAGKNKPEQQQPAPVGASPENPYVSEASKNARAQMNRVKNIFMKTDDDSDSEDESYYEDLEGLFGEDGEGQKASDGAEKSHGANNLLKNMFSKRDTDDDDDDDDDDDEDDKPSVGKKDIKSLFKTDNVDDDDDKY